MIAVLLKRLDTWERRLCVLAFSILTAVLFADVAFREITGNGLTWATQTGVYANMVVALFGLGLATTSGSHLRPRFTDNWLPAAWNPALCRLGHLISATVLTLFALLATQLALETRQLGETATVLRISLWPLQLLLSLSFASAALRFCCFAIRPGLAPENA